MKFAIAIRCGLALCAAAEATGAGLAVRGFARAARLLKSAEDSAAAPAAPGPVPAPAPVPQVDNMYDEIIDQANPEFTMTDLDGNGCISYQELMNPLKVQFNNTARQDLSPQQRSVMSKRRKAILQAMEDAFHTKDTNHDDCIDKQEFKHTKVGQMKIDMCSDQFHLMDTSGDNKVSLQEAWDFVGSMMTNADLSHTKLTKMWEAADVNKDGYITIDEFCEMGPRYDGDGQGQ